jgi:hypothetical protein
MNLPLKWQGGSEPSPLAHVIPIAIEEGRRRTPLLIGMFAGIALAALAIGMVLPQKYTSRTVIFVEDSNIIGPLMEGCGSDRSEQPCRDHAAGGLQFPGHAGDPEDRRLDGGIAFEDRAG